MSWWGKLFGGTFGFLLGGPLGALLGAALGHNLDRGLQGLKHEARSGYGSSHQERVQTVFFTATFSVMGHLAKVDGHVTAGEIELAEMVMAHMRLNPEQKQAAMRLFEEGKRPGFPLRQVILQFKRECNRRRSLLRMFIEMQLQAAYADGELHSTEKILLIRICDLLGFARHEFDQLDAMIRAQLHFTGATGRVSAGVHSLADAYAVLGVDRNAEDNEVKKAYRRLMNQHHPDKLVAKGLPEEMMKMATEKTHEIRSAYEEIREARKA